LTVVLLEFACKQLLCPYLASKELKEKPYKEVKKSDKTSFLGQGKAPL